MLRDLKFPRPVRGERSDLLYDQAAQPVPRPPFGCHAVAYEPGVWGLGFGVWWLGFGVWDLGFGVWGLEFGVPEGSGFGVWFFLGLGSGVWVLGSFGVAWGVGGGVVRVKKMTAKTERAPRQRCHGG